MFQRGSSTTNQPRKFGIDYDIFAGLKTVGFIKVLTHADLVLMTTTEERNLFVFGK